MTDPDASQFYTGLVAQLYRHLRSSVFDPAPYIRFVRRSGEPALELGCGDGDPILDLIEAGLLVEGLDSSADMIDRCRNAAAARGLDVVLHHQSIEAMDLGRRYRSIYLAGATFNLIVDDAAAELALQRIAAHLSPGGSVLIPLFIPESTPAAAIGRAREHIGDDGSTMRFMVTAETRDDEARVQRTMSRYEVVRNGEVVDSVERPWIIHWHTRDGFRSLAERAGLTVSALFEDRAGDDAPLDGPGAFTFLLTLAS